MRSFGLKARSRIRKRALTVEAKTVERTGAGLRHMAGEVSAVFGIELFRWNGSIVEDYFDFLADRSPHPKMCAAVAEQFSSDGVSSHFVEGSAGA